MGKLAVSGKGSAFNVNDSTATARVLVDWLIRIGFLVVAALAVLKPGINKRTNEKTKPFAAQHGKLFFIRMGSVAIFRNDSRSQVRSHTRSGAPWLVNQVVANIPFLTLSPTMFLDD
jgi:hypothetical protein